MHSRSRSSLVAECTIQHVSGLALKFREHMAV